MHYCTLRPGAVTAAPTKQGRDLHAQAAALLFMFLVTFTLSAGQAAYSPKQVDVGDQTDDIRSKSKKTPPLELTAWPDFTVGLVNDGTMIHVFGAFKPGVARAVADLVRENPKVQAIVLNSAGGLVQQGKELADIILENGLSTYTRSGCYSACLIAFVAGRKRYLAQGANIGSHQFSLLDNSPIHGSEADRALAFLQDDVAEFYRSRGITDEFVDRMFIAGPDDYWVPTVAELMDSGFIHEVVDPTTIRLDIDPMLNRADLAAALDDLDWLEELRVKSPDVYHSLRMDLDDRLDDEATGEDIRSVVMNRLTPVYQEALRSTSNSALVALFRAMRDLMKLLSGIEPIVCLKLWDPDKYGVVINVTDYVRDMRELTPLLMAMVRVIASRSAEDHAVDERQADADIRSVAQQFVARDEKQARYLRHGIELNNRNDYRLACNAAIAFMSDMLRLPEGNFSNLVRSLFAGTYAVP